MASKNDIATTLISGLKVEIEHDVVTMLDYGQSNDVGETTL